MSNTFKTNNKKQVTTDASLNNFIAQIDCSLLEKMALQCPFTWRPQTENLSESVIKKIENSLQGLEKRQGERTQWTKFIQNLILSYEYFKSGEFDEAFHKQNECEKIIEYFESSVQLTFASKTAFKHVCLSNKMFLLSETRKSEISEIMRNIKDVKDMDNKERATVWSVGACVLMNYDSKNEEQSIRYVENALELDPECAEWYYLLGRLLGRKRRKNTLNPIPGDREMEVLEFAVNKSNDPGHKVHLAQVYMEKARATYVERLKSHAVDFESEVKDLNEKSSLLYRDALKNNGDNGYVLYKCAKGFNSLHGEFRDSNLAKECILRGLELQPGDAVMCYAAALIFREEDPDRAKQYFSQSIENGHFTSCYQLLRMKHQDNESYDPRADIERYVAIFTEVYHRERLFAWLGAFHFYVRHDFNSSLDSWLQIFNENNQSSILSEVYVPWNIKHWKINISKIIIGEISKKIVYPNDSEEHKKYTAILKNFENQRPDLYMEHTTATAQQNQRSWRTPLSGNTSSVSRYESESNWRRKRPL